MNSPLEIFRANERRLHGIAYRMLASRADAEDMVQETYVRWHRADVDAILAPQAWLSTTITHLCIDRLRALRTEREAYVGPWLPEPHEGAAAPPADAASEFASDLSMAFLLVLQRLAPEERAAFLLHDVFDNSYADVALVLDRSEAACRQLVSRARRRVRRERPRYQVSEEARIRLLERFVEALGAQDQVALLAILAPVAVWTSDGGGKATAARKVVRGNRGVARLLLGAWRHALVRFAPALATINGEPGLVFRDRGTTVATVSIVTDGMHVLAGLAVVNPDKLKYFVPCDARALNVAAPKSAPTRSASRAGEGPRSR